MGVYSRWVFPRICEWVMSHPRMTALRRDTLAGVAGNVLEIGFGTGLNLSCYPDRVEKLTALDPNPGMCAQAKRRISQARFTVEHHQIRGESLPFDEASFDHAVSTWTLCSVDDAARVVHEVLRVLRPGGSFVFLEHGVSGDPSVSRWQTRLTPLERVIADGCRLDLDVESLIKSEPFARVEMERFEMDGMPRTHGTMYRGSATR